MIQCTKICSDGKSLDMPKHVEIRLYGWMRIDWRGGGKKEEQKSRETLLLAVPS